MAQLQVPMGLPSTLDEYTFLLFPLSVASVGVAALASIPGLIAIQSQIRHRTPRDNFYEDVDGVSTPEAVAAFSNKRPKAAALLLSILSLGTSVAVSVLSTLSSGRDGLFLENWLVSAALAAVLLQVICISAHHSSVKSHDLGVWAMISSVFAAVAIILQARHIAEDLDTFNDAAFILRAVNAVTSPFWRLPALLSLDARTSSIMAI
ncbi:hypothetical protein PT974_06261 [Cladobotryum mycophilum]|uniref:Uncharacterized protein n=1 Tax=Cladobotryum mycophilum TaxID=491253 RepID=A0ABR0SLC0_9HYPO